MKNLATILLLLVLGSNAIAQDAELIERNVTIEQSRLAFLKGDVRELQRLATHYLNVDRRTASGAFKIEQFDDGIEMALVIRGDDAEAQHQALIARTKTWVDEFPDAPIAYVLHARSLMAYTHYFRGGGYANTVPPLALASYRKYSTEAAEFLLKNQDVASVYTGWHATLINLARQLAWPKNMVNKTMADGLRRSPDDYRMYHHGSPPTPTQRKRTG